jgi:gamma-glutamylcyclotransferase (GGCT)/AIG2-like uncharacterized protein YtfP
MPDTQEKYQVTTTEILRGFTAGGKKETIDLFVYGTLMNDRYVEMLLHRKVEYTKAELHHYICVNLSWSFPFIVKSQGAVTQGRILKDITKDELKILDNFEDEGAMYYRRPVVARVTNHHRQRCQTYIGDISVLNSKINPEIKFEDRFNLYVEKKIDSILQDMPTDRPDLDRRVLRELMGAAVDTIIQSHFDGNYICNYIMIQALENAKPPSLAETLKNKELHPYAGNYMRLACQHIVLNQFIEKVRHEHPESLRVSQNYFQHGLAILIGFLYFNRHSHTIYKMFEQMQLGIIIDGRGYRDYAGIAIDIADTIYNSHEMEELIQFVHSNWHSSPTPLGSELEFSNLGVRAINPEPGEDSVYDSFQWFWDFDMLHRTWRLGGYIDSHRQMSIAQKRHRGFWEYAFGRYNILGDLSRPLFDCPWGMSLLINEAVKFLDITPHSLHISMELTGEHRHITDTRHKESDLVCLLLLGGDLRHDKNGVMREWRIYNNELDTNFQKSIHFSDRKYHFSKPDQDFDEASDVVEYKYMRLHKKEYNYDSIIYALKGYQLHTHVRPINLKKVSKGHKLPEHQFLREWGGSPSGITNTQIENFIKKVEQGLIEEYSGNIKAEKLNQILEKIYTTIEYKNKML